MNWQVFAGGVILILNSEVRAGFVEGAFHAHF
jgi:hypothetical protein